MAHLLHLDSSADTATSTSRAITATFARAWTDAAPGNTITYRDLLTDAPPHLPDAALHWAPRLRGVDAAPPSDAVEWQDALIGELLLADVLLVGAPMYNWSIPSSLKAWIDYIHVMGVTAPFDNADQPLQGRPCMIVTSRGGEYGPGTPNEGQDHEVPALSLVLGTSLGMDVSVVTAELTLADQISAMEPLRDRAHAGWAAAHAYAAELATGLGSAG